MMGRYWHWGNNGMWSINGWGFCLEFLAWSLAVVFFVWLYSRYHRQTKVSEDLHTALDILKTRYAKGEISQEEFHSMKEDLK